MAKLIRKRSIARIHRRVRKKVAGTAGRPRLCVHFSNQNVYAQVIDDEAGRTLAAASTLDKGFDGAKSAGVASAEKVGALVGERAATAKVGEVVFDRGGFKYHGKVKALADAARKAGLKF